MQMTKERLERYCTTRAPVAVISVSLQEAEEVHILDVLDALRHARCLEELPVGAPVRPLRVVGLVKEERLHLIVCDIRVSVHDVNL